MVQKSRARHAVLLVALVALVSLSSLGPTGAPLQAQSTQYQPTWASVGRHNPAPEWFKDAKFGIYFHWGPFSVPAYGSEWYPRNMYNTGSGEYNYHTTNYGSPTGNWPYHNFINGANDRSGRFIQFAPRLASAGGAFDPNAWAQLFVDAGAKFAGPVAEHHDGYSMWNSRVNEWNSVGKGPRLDLAGLFATAIRGKGLKLFMSSHHAYNFTGYYQWVPRQSDPSLQRLYGQLPSAQQYQFWVDKLKELIDGYQPDIMYHDFNVTQIPEAYRLDYLAYYYNKSIDWGKETIVVHKDGGFRSGELLDYERGGPADLTSYYWLTDDAISSSTWSYTNGMRYYSTASLLHALIDRVSKNGNMILNISPMADGTIPQAQKDILLNMGAWLQRNGEAIYATRAWTTYGEGPTKMGGGILQQPVAGTPQDIRYTRSKDNRVLYATVLGWPGNGAQLKLTSLASGKIDLSGLTGVQLITNPGSYTNLAYRQDSTGLNITMPATQPFPALAYSLRLTFASQIPAKVVFYQDINYGGTAVGLSPGSYTTAQLAAAGIPNNWVSSVSVPSGHTVEIYDQDNFGGTRWTLTASNVDFVAAGMNDMMSSVRISAPSTPTPTRTPATTTALPSATPTRAVTATPGTPTVPPTNTPIPSSTPTPGGGTPCSPVTATITAPFTYDGAGTFCWQTASIPNYINSWNLDSLTINGSSFVNIYAAPSQLPPKINGWWYISYRGQYSWSHFEAK